MDGYWTPRILYVSREFWKPGHDAELNRIEAEGARVCIGLGVPRPYLGIESLTGSKEVCYLNGFASSCSGTRLMTLRYAHLAPDVRRDAVKLLDGPAQHGRNIKPSTRASARSHWGKQLGN